MKVNKYTNLTDKKIKKNTVLSATVFLQYQNEYLFVHRVKKGNSVDFGRWNGIGGKVEPNESYLECCLREVKEETGYDLAPTSCRLAVIANIHGGYAEDWSMCFFVCQVFSKEVPSGLNNDEGELRWINKDLVLNSKLNLVDDLHYLWQDMIDNQGLIFFNAELGANQEIISYSKQVISNISNSGVN